MTAPYPTSHHTRATTYSRAGLYALPAGAWGATATVRTQTGSLVQALAVNLAELGSPDVDGNTHALSVLATAAETATWPLQQLLCDIIFTDASVTPVKVPAVTVAINVSGHTPPLSDADNPLQTISGDMAPVLRGATGPAGAIPDIGEIRYFSTAPTGLGWMACDGAPYLRTAYPDYEGMRPKSAFKHTLIYQSATNSGPGGFSCWTGQYFLSCGVANYDRSIYRSTDLVNWTSVSNALPAGYGGPEHNLYSFGTTGRVLALDRGLGKCVVSLDHGATWNTADNIALPTTTPQAGVRPLWSLPKLMSTGKVITFLMEADIAATSSDGVTWSKVQLPFHARWECIHDMYPADSDVWAADPSQPGKFIGIWENAYYGQGHDLPHAGLFNDWRGTNDATGSTYYVSMSNRQKQLYFSSNDGTYMQKQILYDTPIDVGQLGGTGFVNGRFIARAGRDLFIFDPNTVECEYIKDFFGVPPINTYLGTCVPKDGTIYMFIGGNQPEITSITVDPLKFNAPGLAPKAGATPYVYTGA